MSAVPDDCSSRRVLLLGGSSEARQLAALLTSLGVPVISSLAGRLAAPSLPAGEVRVGGFGGVDGLTAWLGRQGIAAVVDATHPFAAGISAMADEACQRAGLPLMRLERPGWSVQPGDRWHWASDLSGAARLVPQLGQRALLAIGRQGVSAFVGAPDVWFLVRCIETPTGSLPPKSELLLTRGPFTLAGELALIDQHRIDVVVTKNSGGGATDAKLAAARVRGLPVVMVRRPKSTQTQSVADVDAALAWVRSVVGGSIG